MRVGKVRTQSGRAPEALRRPLEQATLLERLTKQIMHLNIARQGAARRLEPRQRILVWTPRPRCARQRPLRDGRSLSAAVLVLSAAAAGTGLVASERRSHGRPIE